MSAAQLRAVAQTVTAQRQSIAAMQAQLEAFDQQLAVFERILDPLVEWSATWARLEEAVGDFVRRDGADGTAPGRLRAPAPSGRRPGRRRSSCGRRRRIPVTEPIRVCACRSPWISGMRSSWMRRRVSGHGVDRGVVEHPPDPLEAGLERPHRLLELLDQVLEPLGDPLRRLDRLPGHGGGLR